MSIQIAPRLRRTNVMFNSFSSCISNTPKEFSWTPKMSMSEIISQPRMFLHQLEGRITFKQLQCFTDRHCWRQLNKQMDVVNSNTKLVNFTSMFQSNLSDKSFTINFKPIKLEGVHCIFRFPYKMEGILPEGMFKTLQIHFNLAEYSSCYIQNLVHGASIKPLDINKHQELNIEDGNSSIGLKAEVSLPLM